MVDHFYLPATRVLKVDLWLLLLPHGSPEDPRCRPELADFVCRRLHWQPDRNRSRQTELEKLRHSD